MSDLVVEVCDLQIKIKNKVILQDVNLNVEKGAFHGVIGPNGAGKTTLFTTIQGFRAPTKGSVRLLGVNPRPRNIELLGRIGIQPQATAFFPKTTLREHLSVVADIFGASRTRIDSLIESLDLSHAADTKVEGLSGGERQRLAVATAIVHDPQVLFLDEPTAGLDADARHNLVSLLRQTDLGGTAILYTTHFLDEAEHLCDTVTILDSGRVVTTDSPRRLIAAANLGSTVLLPHASTQADLLQSTFGPAKVSVTSDGVEVSTHDTAELFSELKNLGINTRSAQVRDGRLEDVYLNLTGKDYVA